MACLRETLRDRATIGVEQNRPILTPGVPKAAWSEAMALNTAKRDEAVWAELRHHFNDAEIVEISLACAMFNMINRLNDSFRTELEPEEYNRRQHGAVGVTAQALEDYACRICEAART